MMWKTRMWKNRMERRARIGLLILYARLVYLLGDLKIWFSGTPEKSINVRIVRVKGKCAVDMS